MSERPEQRPEGRLIALALKRSRLSARKAAAQAGMSENRWRNIVSGYQTVSAGVYAPVRGPAETVARMAHVVGVSAEQLRQADRDDAAAALEELERHDQAHDERDDLLSPETMRLIERLRTDPEMRRRFFDAVLAGHGHTPGSTDSGEDEDARHRAS